MAAGSVASVASAYDLGLAAFITDIQTWLTANATGVIKAVMFVGHVYIAILEVPPSA